MARTEFADIEDLVYWTLIHRRIDGIRWNRESTWGEDELQDAMLGAWEALDEYDTDRADTSSHYLVQRIKWAVSQGRRRRIGPNWHQNGLFENEASLSYPVPDGDGKMVPLGDFLHEPSPEQPGEACRPCGYEPEEVIATLTERERTMVTMTAAEAGQVLGIQRASVGRARVRLYAKLRTQYGTDEPAELVEAA